MEWWHSRASKDHGTHMTMYCPVCQEEVQHVHRQVKPTYEELVAYIQDLQNTVPFSNENYVLYMDMLRRVHEGR